MVWWINRSLNTPDLSQQARMFLITLISFLEQFYKTSAKTGRSPDLRTCRSKMIHKCTARWPLEGTKGLPVEIHFLCAAHHLSINQFHKKNIYTKLLTLSGFSNRMNDFETLCLKKNLSTFSLSLSLIKFNILDTFNPITLQKLLNFYKRSEKEVKMLNHSNLTKRNLLYTFNYTLDKNNLNPNRKFYQKKQFSTVLTLAANSSFLFNLSFG